MKNVYINHHDSDKGNLTIAYVTLDRKLRYCICCSIPIQISIVIFIYGLQTYFIRVCNHVIAYSENKL